MDSQSRQEYIRAAVSFLQNPKLVESSLQDKLKFLRDKGLSQTEIDEALNLALINRHNSRSSRWNFFLVLGLCASAYKLYQAYTLSKETPVAETNKKDRGDTLNKHPMTSKPQYDLQATNSHNPSENISLAEILQRMSELKRLIELQRNNFQSEMQSIKTLLLGHEKFAAPPVIPSWQLKDTSSPDKNETPETNQSNKKKRDKSKKTESIE